MRECGRHPPPAAAARRVTKDEQMEIAGDTRRPSSRQSATRGADRPHPRPHPWPSPPSPTTAKTSFVGDKVI